MICEYLDINSGNQKVFGETNIKNITEYLKSFEPKEEYQEKIKAITLNGLEISKSITNSIINTNSEFIHPDLNDYYQDLKWIDKKVVMGYLYDRMKTVYNMVSNKNNDLQKPPNF